MGEGNTMLADALVPTSDGAALHALMGVLAGHGDNARLEAAASTVLKVAVESSETAATAIIAAGTVQTHPHHEQT